MTQILAGTLIVRLYQNDITPGPGSVLSDFIPCNFPGYADQQMQPGMSTPTINSVDQAFSSSDVLSWVRGAGAGTQTAFGYVVFADLIAGGVIFGAERFRTPRTFSIAGQSLTLQVQVLLASAL
jgi:hypothetical protein